MDRVSAVHAGMVDVSRDPRLIALSYLVAGVVSLARDLRVVAEGVEAAEQLARFREMGCDLAQGYYFSEPLPEGAMDEMLRSLRGAGGFGG